MACLVVGAAGRTVCVLIEDDATYGSKSDGGGGSGDGVGIDAGYESIVYVATTGQADGVYAEVADAENAENAARQTLSLS